MLPQDVRDRVTSYIQHQAQKSRESIVDLVTTSQGRLLDVAGDVSEADSLRRPAGENEWCLRELMRHVVTAQRGVARVVPMLASGQQMPPSDPRVIGGMREDDEAPYSAIIDDLRGVNADMLEAIRTLPASPNLETKFDHPFFGPLNCLEWAVFQRVHDEDHIQHAKRILSTGT